MRLNKLLFGGLALLGLSSGVQGNAYTMKKDFDYYTIVFRQANEDVMHVTWKEPVQKIEIFNDYDRSGAIGDHPRDRYVVLCAKDPVGYTIKSSVPIGFEYEIAQLYVSATFHYYNNRIVVGKDRLMIDKDTLYPRQDAGEKDKQEALQLIDIFLKGANEDYQTYLNEMIR